MFSVVRMSGVLAGCVALSLLVAAPDATAQANSVRQTLDRVHAYTPTELIEMNYERRDEVLDFLARGVRGTSLVQCKLTGAGGLYCLDGDVLWNWPNPADPPSTPGWRNEVLKCSTVTAETLRRASCSGMTVGLDGKVYLAGRKGNSYTIFQSEIVGSAVQSTALYAGRPIVTDMELVEGETAAAFRPCAGTAPECAPRAGILAVESRSDLVFLPTEAPFVAVVLVPRSLWRLDREDLAGATLVQVSVPPAALGGLPTIENFAVATTTRGRVLVKRIATTDPVDATVLTKTQNRTSLPPIVTSVANVTGFRDAPTCSSTQGFPVRASAATGGSTGFVYVADRAGCVVHQLRVLRSGSSIDLDLNVPAAGSVLPLPTLRTLASSGSYSPTYPGSTPTSFPVAGLTVAPGIDVDLLDCGANDPRCPVTKSNNDDISSELVGVRLVEGTPSRAVVFQVLGFPDCRYPQTDWPQALKDACVPGPGETIVQGPAGQPAAQRLNIVPLLPTSVTSQFGRNGLPPLPAELWISGSYVARADRDVGVDYTFDGFFVITENGAQFRETFFFNFDVPLLENPALTTAQAAALRRCEPTEYDGWNPAMPVVTKDLQKLLDWTVIANVSEKKRSVGREYVSRLVNDGCVNPSRSAQDSLSFLPYNLVLSPDTHAPSSYSPDAWYDWTSAWTPASPPPPTASLVYTPNNDAVFARLVLRLFADLEYVQRVYACPPVPNAPIGDCTQLSSTRENAQQKLEKCVEAAFVPKSSAGSENCQAVVSQLQNYRGQLPVSTPPNDVDNRVGELKARVDTLLHVFETRFLNSIPPAGFCVEEGSCPP